MDTSVAAVVSEFEKFRVTAVQALEILEKYAPEKSSLTDMLGGRKEVVVVDSLHDYIVVDTPDALLICPRSHEQHIKQVLEDLTLLDDGCFV